MAAKVKLGCAVFAASFAVLACVPWAVGPEAGCTVSGSLGELTICSKVKDLSGCAAVPWLSALLCGSTCGFCVGRRLRIDSSKHAASWHSNAATAAATDFTTNPANEAPIGGEDRWQPIARVHASNLTYASFVNLYKAPGQPVILEGWLQEHPQLERWDFNRLVEHCGSRKVGFVQRRAAVLADLQGALQGGGLVTTAAARLLDQFLAMKFNTSLDNLMERAQERVTVQELVGRVKSEAVVGISFRTALDYLASSYSVNDFPAAQLCPALASDVVLPLWSAAESLAFQEPWLEDRRQFPTVFIEADGSRAYPAHQHANDLTHGFQVLLEGEKEVVWWPYEQRSALSLSRITTEDNDEIYFAEGIHRRFDLFPEMAFTDARYGTLKKGDLLFVPCSGVHVFESKGASFGVRFMNHDPISVTCGKSLLQQGSKAVHSSYIEYLSSLQPIAYEPAVVDNAGGSASGHANGAVSNGGTGGDGDGKEGPAHAVPSPLSSSSHLSPSSLEELESQLKAAAVAKGEDARLSKRQRIAAAAARAKHRGWAIPVDDL